MTIVSTVAIPIEVSEPTKNKVHVVGRIVPSMMMRSRIGRSRKWVNDGTTSPRAPDLGTDEAATVALGENEACSVGKRDRRDQQEKAPRDRGLHRDDGGLGAEQLAEGGREPKGGDRDNGHATGDRMDQFDHGRLLLADIKSGKVQIVVYTREARSQTIRRLVERLLGAIAFGEVA